MCVQEISMNRWPCVLILCFVFQTTLLASNDVIPQWLEKNMSQAMQGSGKWIADNSRYKSEQEPYDAYGIQYSWGLGKKSLNSRLYGITNGTEAGTFWEYRLFWHPGEKKAFLHQFGGDGTFGSGELKPLGESGKFELIQTFFSPDGSTWQTKHESIETEKERQTISFSYQDGAWKENRTYVWRPSN
jgi:hypothetical protein